MPSGNSNILLLHRSFHVDPEYGELFILHLLEAQARIDMVWLNRHRNTPNIYSSGVIYRETVEWQDIPSTISLGSGDCKTLAAWRVAELRIRNNVKCRPFIKWREWKDGFRLYHVLVRVEHNGRIIFEDPSRRLGMKG